MTLILAGIWKHVADLIFVSHATSITWETPSHLANARERD